MEAISKAFPPLRPTVDSVSIASSFSTFSLSFEGFFTLIGVGIDSHWTIKSARVEFASPALIQALANKAFDQAFKTQLETFSCVHLSCSSINEVEDCISLLEYCDSWEVDKLNFCQAGRMEWRRLASIVGKGKIGCLLTATKTEQGAGREEHLRKVWSATGLLWVVSSTTENTMKVFEKDNDEEEWWNKVKGSLA